MNGALPCCLKTEIVGCFQDWPGILQRGTFTKLRCFIRFLAARDFGLNCFLMSVVEVPQVPQGLQLPIYFDKMKENDTSSNANSRGLVMCITILSLVGVKVQ